MKVVSRAYMVSTGEFIGRRVGRFTITSHLASGGMAELFVARQEAVGGFEKDLVLKMLQERYAENPRVVEMFLDEARLAAKLNHQNIVHVYDVDEAEGIRYIAMEYIHGETVTDIIRRSMAQGGFLPLEHAIHIVAETAAGLAYAHQSRDPEGRPARIVHRDVSPSNILVTYEGLTKIVDFGIARVQDQIREESGMRPGKVSYMSPEQVRGEPADHRSDIFSLGIILYEITVGRRLWRGPPEVVMRRIVEESIPPPTYVRRDYPPALELIVMKALERRPADRHQSAADLQHELGDFMEDAGLKSGSRRLSQYMKELFAADLIGEEERSRPVRPVPSLARPSTASSSSATPLGGLVDLEDAEELDFDRRAPLMMRMEARRDESGVVERRVAPDPLAGERNGAVQGPDRRTGAAPPGRPNTPGRASGTPGRATPSLGTAVLGDGSARAARQSGSFPASGEHAGLGTHSPPSGPRQPVSNLGIPARVPGTATDPHWTSPLAIGSGSDAVGAANPGSSAILAASRGASGSPVGASSPQIARTEPVSAGLRWAIVLLLAAALVVVFLATR